MADFHSFQTRAVILKHVDYGEIDRLITLYTREKGLVRAVAKGVRKITSRKAGHLEPFGEVTLQMARGHDLSLITQAETIHAFPELSSDLTKAAAAAYVAELTLRFFSEGSESEPQVFDLLVSTLAQIATGASGWMATRCYELALLEVSGFRPQLFDCAICGAPIQPEDQFFSFASGGAVCPRCAGSAPDRRPVSMTALKYLRHAQRTDFETAIHARVPEAACAEIEGLMHDFLAHLLERKLNTPEFIELVRPPASDSR